tara:strand:- start:1073 stop:1249 length:177 start_codon:yes stop_codon:yes gene_type:complete
LQEHILTAANQHQKLARRQYSTTAVLAAEVPLYRLEFDVKVDHGLAIVSTNVTESSND